MTPGHIGVDPGAPGGDKLALALFERTADGMRLLQQQAGVKVADVLDALEAVFRAQLSPPRWVVVTESYLRTLRGPWTRVRPQRGVRGRKRCVIRLMGARPRRA